MTQKQYIKQLNVKPIPESKMISVYKDHLYEGFLFSAAAAKIKYKDNLLQIVLTENNRQYYFYHEAEVTIDPSIILSEDLEIPVYQHDFVFNDELAATFQSFLGDVKVEKHKHVKVTEQILK